MTFVITQEIKERFKKIFVTQTFKNDDGRGHDRTITVFSDSIPEDIQAAFRDTGMEIDDYHFEWMREFIDEFCCEIDVGGSYEVDEIDDIFDYIRSMIEADIYTADRLQWLASNLNKTCYVTDALQEILCATAEASKYKSGRFSTDVTCEDLIGRGQALEKDEVCGYCKDAVIEVLKILCEGGNNNAED
jgi:hypothetical protein